MLASATMTVEEYLFFCDCNCAIEAVDRKMESVRYSDIYKRLTEVQRQLKIMDKYVSLVNIPGHSGINGKELAQNLAHSIAVGNVEANEDITVTDVYKMSQDIAMRSWQRKWNEENVGRTTYSLIPEVSTKVTFPKKREVGA